MGCHFLLQGIFLTQESNPGLLHCRQILSQLSYKGSPNEMINVLEKKKNHLVHNSICDMLVPLPLLLGFTYFICKMGLASSLPHKNQRRNTEQRQLHKLGSATCTSCYYDTGYFIFVIFDSVTPLCSRDSLNLKKRTRMRSGLWARPPF